MKFVANECPKCRAALDVQSRFCSHCGTAVVLDDEAVRTQHTYQKVDDARIREADVKETIRLKELEIEQAKLQNTINQRKRLINLKLMLVLSFLIALIILAFMSNGNPIASLLALCLPVVMCIVLPFAFRKQE